MSEDIVERLSGVYVYPAVAPHSEAISEAITEIVALRAKLETAVKALEETPKADDRYPSMFYSEDRSQRVGVAHYRDQNGPQPFVTIATLLENKPGGHWVHVELSADEAEQMGLHLLEKAKSARRAAKE